MRAGSGSRRRNSSKLTASPQAGTDQAAVALLRALHEPDAANPPLIEAAVAAAPDATVFDIFTSADGTARSAATEPTPRRRRGVANMLVARIGEDEFEQRYTAA